VRLGPEERVMSGKVQFGIIAASLCLTAALVWCGASLTALFMHWLSEHPRAAKAMPLFPMVVLPVVAVILHRRRSRPVILA
jgi:hypothetical protein